MILNNFKRKRLYGMNNKIENSDVKMMKKSRYKEPKPFLRPSTSTNIIYEVNGLTEDEIEYVNSLNRPKSIMLDKIKALRKSGIKLKYVGMKNPIFEDNLRLIKQDFPEYLSEVIKMYYFNGEGSFRSALNAAVYWGLIADKDKSFYKEASIRFLEAVDSGMQAYIPWDGITNSENGAYLWQNTKFIRGATSRLDFMDLYQENGKTYIKLNFGIAIKE